MLLCSTRFAAAQQLDSIKYAYGHLYYHSWGRGTPVIVLSGGPGNSCLQQQDVAIALGKHYRAILLEQRGTGLSIPSRFDSTTINLQSAVDDIRLLMQHLGLRNAIIFGHSWGGMLAMSFAAEHPDKVKALVLSNPGFYKFSDEWMTTLSNNLRARVGRAELALLDSLEKKISEGKSSEEENAQYSRTMRLAYVYDKANIDSLLKKIYIAKSNATMQGLIWQDLQRIHFDLSKSLFHYKGPVYVIGGRQDLLAFCTYELKMIRPDAKLYWIQASGHFPMFEQAQAFEKQLEEIMGEIVK